MRLVASRVTDGEAEALERRDNCAQPHNGVGVAFERGRSVVSGSSGLLCIGIVDRRGALRNDLDPQAEPH